MTSFPRSPRLVKGGIVQIDAQTAAVRQVIALQYNPDSISRTLQVKGAGAASGDRSEALRLTGPPVETIKLEIQIDATDQLEFPDQNADAVSSGIQPRLASLEMLIYPSTSQLQANDALARSGTLEIVPMEANLTLFVWSSNRVVPVRVTDCSITEEAFDPALNPIRAKVSLGFRVLSVDDLGFSHKGGSLYIAYQQQKERLASRYTGAALTALGISGIPQG
jgi:Contractile injection system tube protein